MFEEACYEMDCSSIQWYLRAYRWQQSVRIDLMYGEFVLTQEKIQIPKAGKIYAFNDGNYQLWDDRLKKYIDNLKDTGPSRKPYSARYIRSLVGDFHRTLLHGGIYWHPRDKKNEKGMLRLLYECRSMSFIVEQTGGKGSGGYQRILDIEPVEIHPLGKSTTPLYATAAINQTFQIRTAS